MVKIIHASDLPDFDMAEQFDSTQAMAEYLSP